jgi:hypothetical protein
VLYGEGVEMNSSTGGGKRGRLKDDAHKTKRIRAIPGNHCFFDGTTLGNSTYPNFLLNADVASDVFSFLDIRSLYNMTMTCKLAMKLLRHEYVVRSALMQGGHSKTSMERLMVLIVNRCIWIPSPLRMLRLCNGRTCERCFTGRVHLVSEHFGVFFCFRNCIQNIFTKGVAFNIQWAPFLINQPRVAKCAYNTSAQLWVRPYSDLSGERCGPLVSMIELERVIRGQGSLKQILKEKDMADTYKKSVSDIARVFKDTTDKALKRIQERKQKKKQASLDANDRRKKKVMDMVDILRIELDDVPWKDSALSHCWVKSGNRHVIEFDGITNELMREYSAAPSKATKKKLKEVAFSLRKCVARLEEANIHDFSFLSDAHPVERAVKIYCRDHYPNYKILGLLNEAVANRIVTESKKDMFESLLGLLPTDIGTILAPVIVSTVGIQDDESRNKAIQQAILLSRIFLKGSADPRVVRRHHQPPTPLQLYNHLSESYPRLYQNTSEFMQMPETLAWKELHGRDGFGRLANNPEAAMQRVETVVQQIWNGLVDGLQERLLQRDYKAVLKILWVRGTHF